MEELKVKSSHIYLFIYFNKEKLLPKEDVLKFFYKRRLGSHRRSAKYWLFIEDYLKVL